MAEENLASAACLWMDVHWVAFLALGSLESKYCQEYGKLGSESTLRSCWDLLLFLHLPTINPIKGCTDLGELKPQFFYKIGYYTVLFPWNPRNQ